MLYIYIYIYITNPSFESLKNLSPQILFIWYQLKEPTRIMEDDLRGKKKCFSRWMVFKKEQKKKKNVSFKILIALLINLHLCHLHLVHDYFHLKDKSNTIIICWVIISSSISILISYLDECILLFLKYIYIYLK